MRTIRALVWEVLNTCPSENYEGHLHHFLSMDPACCERQATVANAKAWLGSSEGKEWARNRALNETRNPEGEYRGY